VVLKRNRRIESLSLDRLFSLLKESAVAGAAWRAHCTPLRASLDLIETLPVVRHVSLSGDQLRAIAGEKSSVQNLEQALGAAGIHDVRI